MLYEAQPHKLPISNAILSMPLLSHSDSTLSKDKVQTPRVCTQCLPDLALAVSFLTCLLGSSSTTDQRACCLASDHSTLTPDVFFSPNVFPSALFTQTLPLSTVPVPSHENLVITSSVEFLQHLLPGLQITTSLFSCSVEQELQLITIYPWSLPTRVSHGQQYAQSNNCLLRIKK